MAKVYLSSTYGDLIDYREAVAKILRQMGHEAVAMEDYVATGKHPPLSKCLSDVATSLNNLAGLYQSQGRYEEAEPLYQQALALRQELLGERHPDVATSLNNLAALYESQGRYEEAMQYYQAAIAIALQILGENHPNTTTFMRNYRYMLVSAPVYEIMPLLSPEMQEQVLQMREDM